MAGELGYRVEVYRLGFMAYRWEVYDARIPGPSCLSDVGALVWCVASTKRGALRAAKRWINRQDAHRTPVVVREFP